MRLPSLVLTLTLSIFAAGCGDDEELGAESLGQEVSEQVEAADLDEAECLLPDDLIADATDQEITESGGTAGGAGGGSSDPGAPSYSISYEGCDYFLADEGEVTVAELVDTEDATALEGFDQITALVGADDDAQTVTNLGDDAVLLNDTLYVLVGERAFYVAGEDAEGQPYDPTVLEAIAAALTEIN